ncbi:MAG: nitronate monooxygenase, partial [Gammaproteobacteria bacterium]
MKSPICDMLGIEFPLLAFTHCRDVVVAVSKAGGMGILGAVNLPPSALRQELDWIDQNVGGKPYGIDLIVPNKFVGKDADAHDASGLRQMVPAEHLKYARDIMQRHGIEFDPSAQMEQSSTFSENLRADAAASSLEVAFEYPIKLVANALGVPPKVMLELGKQHNVPIAALV